VGKAIARCPGRTPAGTIAGTVADTDTPPGSPSSKVVIVSLLTPLPISRTFDYRVRTATRDDIPAMGYVLASAYHDDPVLSWVLPDETRRRVRLRGIMELFAGRFQRHGENRINEAGTGAAVWAPPGATFTPEEDLRFEAGLVTASAGDLSRLGALIELLDEHRPDVPHHYLNLLGVIPDRQGAGIGSALLRAVLDGADRRRVPAYLEATSARNRDLYERHGFEVRAELRTSDCPPLWAMWRPG
jgi:GNAT superfamily N-acetyltransferase